MFFGIRFVRLLAVTLLIAIGAIGVQRPVSAQDAGEVNVTAEVAIPIEMTLSICDTTANFGSGLTYKGAPVTGTDDNVVATTLSSTGTAVYYRWDPNCTGAALVSVTSNVNWNLTVCAENRGSTTSVSVQDGDLRFAQSAYTNYGLATNNSVSLPLCSSSTYQIGPTQSPGSNLSVPVHLLLNIDQVDTIGTFSAGVIFTLTP